MAEWGVKGNLGITVSGWTTTRQGYTMMETLSAQNISLTFSAAGTKSTEVLTLDCPQDITITATISTSHASGFLWQQDATYFIVYDANMTQICTFNHAPTSSASNGSLNGTVNITFRKGVNHLYFKASPVYVGAPTGYGFTDLSIVFGVIYPILDPSPSFGLRVI